MPGIIIVPARTSGEHTDESGITLLAVPGDTKGISRKGYTTVDGLRAAELKFDDVVVAC